jgi:uncharacterized membrane protein
MLPLFNRPDFTSGPKRAFAIVFICTLLVKLWLSSTLPITGDEALFYWWGTNLNWGYYDHPPIIGWLIGLIKIFGESPVVLRLPTVIATHGIALGLIDLLTRLSPNNNERKWWIASAYLLIPISWIGVPITNDTPLMIFIFLSGYCFIRAELLTADLSAQRANRSQQYKWFIFCGIFFGLAFLSKYLAVVLALTFAVVLARPRAWGGKGAKHAILITAMIGAISAVFALINLWYNANNCWNNIMFNAINRHDESSVGLQNSAFYLLMMVYLLTPWMIWAAWKSRQENHHHKGLLLFVSVSAIFFLSISIFKTIGLHWVVGYLPFVFLFFGTAISGYRMPHCNRLTLWLGLPHLLFFIVIFSLPNSLLNKTPLSKDLGFLYDAASLPALALDIAGNDAVLMAEGYSPASILGYHAKRYIPVFGVGSRYARQDDIEIDFRKYNGYSMAVILRKEKPLAQFSPFFESVSIQPITVNGRSYWVVTGNRFNYIAYRDTVLTEIAQRFYQIPKMLPVFSCPFTRRYDL